MRKFKYNVRKTKSLIMAEWHCSKGKDIGEIRYFIDDGTEYKEVTRDHAHSFWVSGRPSMMGTIIASKAVGRRRPEIVIPYTRY